MSNLTTLMQQAARRRDGQGMVEYVVIIVVLVLIVALALGGGAGMISDWIGRVFGQWFA